MTYSILISDLQKASGLESSLNSLETEARKMGIGRAATLSTSFMDFFPFPVGGIPGNSGVEREVLAILCGGKDNIAQYVRDNPQVRNEINKVVCEDAKKLALETLDFGSLLLRTDVFPDPVSTNAFPSLDLSSLSAAMRLAKRFVPTSNDSWFFI